MRLLARLPRAYARRAKRMTSGGARRARSQRCAALPSARLNHGGCSLCYRGCRCAVPLQRMPAVRAAAANTASRLSYVICGYAWSMCRLCTTCSTAIRYDAAQLSDHTHAGTLLRCPDVCSTVHRGLSEWPEMAKSILQPAGVHVPPAAVALPALPARGMVWCCPSALAKAVLGRPA